MSVLIDPYMFELANEQEIKDNISFFDRIIRLSASQENGNGIQIALYKGMIERLHALPFQPFTNTASTISDTELKQIILQINQRFQNLLIKSIESIDIDGCGYGDQCFQVDEGNVDDDKYFELFWTLLVPCYNPQIVLDDRILTGNKAKGRKVGDSCLLSCNCIKHYSKTCRFVGIEEFISVKDQSLEELRRIKLSGGIKVVDVVEAIMGDHHNLVQADGKEFHFLDDLSRKNKMVLNLLKEFGLYKIIFARQMSQGMRGAGNMYITDHKEYNVQDILEVRFFAETQVVMETELYFPKGIGKLLHCYFQRDLLTYASVSELIEGIG